MYPYALSATSPECPDALRISWMTADAKLGAARWRRVERGIKRSTVRRVAVSSYPATEQVRNELANASL